MFKLAALNINILQQKQTVSQSGNVLLNSVGEPFLVFLSVSRVESNETIMELYLQVPF